MGKVSTQEGMRSSRPFAYNGGGGWKLIVLVHTY